MLNILRVKVPHIYWELNWGELYPDAAAKYSDICVPEFQIDEAEYIISLLEKGRDLTGYRPDKRFPLLFERDNGNFCVLKPLTMFAQKIQELIDLFQTRPEEDMALYLRRVSRVLLSIYTLQNDLPDCAGGAYYQPGLSFSLSIKLEPLMTHFGVPDIFREQAAEQELEKNLDRITETLYAGFAHYNMYRETGNYKYLTIAVNVWKNQFGGEQGWGKATANCLKIIHHASIYLQQGGKPSAKDIKDYSREIKAK